MFLRTTILTSYRTLLLARLVISALFLAMAFPADAGEFAVSPMLINIDTEGGSAEPFEISVTGKQTGKISLSVFAMEQQTSGHMNFLEEAEAGPADWITFERRGYDIRAGESTLIKGTLRAPRTEKGTYLAAIMVEEDTGDATNNIVIKVRYAVILNINIGAPGARVQTEFVEVNLVERDGITFVEGTFTNRGAHMGFLESSVQIRGPDRRLIEKLPLRTESAWQRGDRASRVYPGAEVRILAPLPRSLASGEYSLLVRNQFNGRVQPVYRAAITHTSTTIDDADTTLIALVEEVITVKPLASGISLTPVSLRNPSRETVTLDLPSGADPESGVTEYNFVPAQVTLQPGALRRVMLKQRHEKSAPYRSQEFTLIAQADNGRSTELRLTAQAGAPEK